VESVVLDDDELLELLVSEVLPLDVLVEAAAVADVPVVAVEADAWE
jgi:hypothetical protein